MNISKMNALIAKYNYAVPRYTSFPTAVQFKASTDSHSYKNHLQNLKPNESISLYVHIPFCHSLCHYCGCNTKIVNTYKPIAQYIETLLNEIRLAGGLTQKKIPISRIHFGGGSPNYADVKDIEKIVNVCAQYFDTSSMQVDMECDPRLLTKEKIESYARLGVTRVSLGIQDFNEKVQEAMNRKQPVVMVREHVSALRDTNINGINFDLITGLPEQTLDTIEETLNDVFKLRPSRIAVFPYAHVPWMKKHQKLLEKFHLPGPEERFDMGQYMHQSLISNGYHAIGIDHYVLETDSLFHAEKNKTMRRNFQGYTDDPSKIILGFGLSAISQFKDVYTQNTTDAPLYRKSIEEGKFPIARSLDMTHDDIRRRELIEQLMCYFKVDLEHFADIEIPFSDLALLEQDNLITINKNIVSVTNYGMPFTRIVASCFDPYFQKESGRHAKAV